MELLDFPYRPAVHEFRRAALVGDVVAFQRTDLVSLTSVTVTRQPAGSNVTLTTEGARTTATPLTARGVYAFTITADNMQQIATVCCWPREVLAFLPFSHVRQSSIPRTPDEIEPLARRVLHSLCGEVKSSSADSLFAAVGFSAALIGGSADDGINLRTYGCD
jgi:hypothetical protein